MNREESTMTTETNRSHWAALSRLDAPSRERAMRQRFTELLELEAVERGAFEEEMLQAEAELDPEEHAAMAASRLRTWMTFDQDEVQRLAAGLGAARDRVPGEVAMRHVMGVQAVAEEFAAEDLSELIQNAPALREELPDELVGVIDSIAEQGGDSEGPFAETTSAKNATPEGKRFWQFWR
jgi:hypothetical protein